MEQKQEVTVDMGDVSKLDRRLKNLLLEDESKAKYSADMCFLDVSFA
ncbi:unnamed protein product, partial [Amoebophrya sp. A25]|eukprot:GSA25T00022138001.1